VSLLFAAMERVQEAVEDFGARSGSSLLALAIYARQLRACIFLARQSLPLRASRSLCAPVAPSASQSPPNWRALARTGAHWRAAGATGAHWRAAGATGAQLAGAGLAYFSRLLTASVSNCAVEEYVWDDSEGQGLGGKAYSGTVTQCWGSVCSVAGVVSEYSWAIGTTCVERSTTCVPAQRLLRAALQSHLRRRICV
jgi:hypothetical protein